MNSTVLPKRIDFSSRILINSLLGLALIIIIAINIFSFYQVSKFVKADRWVIHTYRVIKSINDGFLNLVQIESETRGFLITHNPKNLHDVEQNKISLFQNFAAAKNLTIDNLEQQKKVLLLEPMLYQRMDLIKKTIQTASEKNQNLQIALVNQGHELTKKIAALINEIFSQELNLLAQRNTASLKNLNQLHIILLVTSIISALLFILGIIILNINLKRQESFLQEKRRYENLLGGIIEGTTDIVVVLDLNYRIIIFNKSFEYEFKSLFNKRPILGASILDNLAHLPDEQKKVSDLWQRALQGEEFSLVGQFGSSPANQNFYEYNFNSIYDENGVLMGAASISRNIEHRIKAENFLKVTNEKLEHAYNELKQHDTEVSLLNEMENSLQSCNSINETLIIISRYCQKLLSFTAGVVYLINPSRNYLEVATEWNAPNIPEKVFSPNQCWGLRQGNNYIYINDSPGIPCGHMHDADSLSYICVPLLAQNDIIGMLQIVVMNSNNISEKDINKLFKKNELLIKNLSVQLALAIANIQLRETLKTRSIRDPLTGLYNRMYLNEFLERDLQRAQRNSVSVTIVMMDVDYFKKLNDKYGHDAGDMALKELGTLLQENVRGTDITCRYGGEEFLLIFYETNINEGTKLVEKLRTQISHMEISLRGTLLDKITASFGLAVFPEHGTTIAALITAADQALYQSKKNGRNRLTICDTSS